MVNQAPSLDLGSIVYYINHPQTQASSISIPTPFSTSSQPLSTPSLKQLSSVEPPTSSRLISTNCSDTLSMVLLSPDTLISANRKLPPEFASAVERPDIHRNENQLTGDRRKPFRYVRSSSETFGEDDQNLAALLSRSVYFFFFFDPLYFSFLLTFKLIGSRKI
ncbi:hypothetical protein HanIR_Chr15g0747231 [Helianthus annuus]|nr:hypothetical protein HanIR_Chr15g0747231 [Helianthus annuus]